MQSFCLIYVSFCSPVKKQEEKKLKSVLLHSDTLSLLLSLPHPLLKKKKERSWVAARVYCKLVSLAFNSLKSKSEKTRNKKINEKGEKQCCYLSKSLVNSAEFLISLFKFCHFCPVVSTASVAAVATKKFKQCFSSLFFFSFFNETFVSR